MGSQELSGTWEGGDSTNAADVMDTHFAAPLFQRKSEAGMHWRQRRPGRSPMPCEEAGRRAANQDSQRVQQPWWSADHFPGVGSGTRVLDSMLSH